MRDFFNKAGNLFKSNPDKIDDRGYTRLQRAIDSGDLKKVKALIKAGADVNFKGHLIYPPAHLALKKNRPQILLTLLEAGAAINMPDDLGDSLLHIAVARNQEVIILMLLNMKADPGVRDRDGRTPLHLVSAEYPHLVDLLARQGAPLNAQDRNGNTALHDSLDYPALLERLLSAGADPNVRNGKGLSSYALMLQQGRLDRYPERLQQLIALKADLGAANPLGETILHLAVRLGMKETFLSLISKAELTAKDNNGNNLLHALVRTQNTQMIEQVLARVPELVKETNNKGLTPLKDLLCNAEKAASGFDDRYISVARMLVAHGGDINSADGQGRSLLHLAVAHGRMDFLEELLRKNADPNLKNALGKTPLHIAIAARNVPAMDALLDNGADPDVTDARGWTILDRLAEQGDRDSPVVQRLIVAGGQYQKQLPLHPELMRRPGIADKRKQGAGKPFGGPRI